MRMLRLKLSLAALLCSAAVSCTAHADAVSELTNYARAQSTSGLQVVQDGRTLINQDGAAVDVASIQKSVVAVLIGIASDKGLLDVSRPVADFVGPGWSKAPVAAEAKITVLNLLQMNSGLRHDLSHDAEPGAKFFYNTPAYRVLHAVLERVSGLTLPDLTDRWLLKPAGMHETVWRRRPDGNWALYSTARDIGTLGTLILNRGSGLLSERETSALLTPSTSNPRYGRLWWIGSYSLDPTKPPVNGMASALGTWSNKLLILTNERVVVARVGAQASDKNFDDEIWRLVSDAVATRR